MKLLRTEQPPVCAEEAAIWWATRRQSDPARFASDEAFRQWVAEDANARAWHDVARRIDQVGAFATMPEIREMRRTALEVARNPRGLYRHRWATGAAIAASLAGAFFLGDILGLKPADPAPVSAGNVQRFATAIGQRRDVLLSDGSKVTLNTASLIEVRYSSDRRDVRLLRGQAMFHVAKNAERPFVVSARNRLVTALGTAFDVQIREDGQLQILLVEGSVRVDPARQQGWGRIIPALARTELMPGQQLITKGPDAGEVTAADVERETAWNRGVLVFRNETLNDAINDINRYSQFQLVVDDPDVAALKVSGIFPTADQENFIAALETLYPVRARKEQGGTIRLVRRESSSAPVK